MLNSLRYRAHIIYSRLTRSRWYNALRNAIFRHRYDWLVANYANVLEAKRAKALEGREIEVAFYVWETSKWKYETLYRLLERDARFHPYIVVVPFAGGAAVQDDYIGKMRQVAQFFSSRGHDVVVPLASDGHTVLERRDSPALNPDIIFYMNCWHEYGRFRQFGHRANTDALQAYVPYAWMISARYDEHFNRDFHNTMWRVFYETPLHVDMARRHAINRGVNAVATGHPMLDVFFDKSYVPHDVWKRQDRPKKRVVWAAHHDFCLNNSCACFLYIFQLMLDLAVKYRGTVQFAFKPHPELARTLAQTAHGWDKARQESYFQQWREMPNTQLCEDEYVDLFLTSDAIIHDCGSFTAEYLCTGKPMLFLESNANVIPGWNDCGRAIADHVYRSRRGERIEWFIEEVVVGGHDTMRQERQQFVDENLRPKGEGGAAANIYNHIVSQLEMDAD